MAKRVISSDLFEQLKKSATEESTAKEIKFSEADLKDLAPLLDMILEILDVRIRYIETEEQRTYFVGKLGEIPIKIKIDK